MNHWAMQYIGVKWVNGGRDMATGVDCWGLLHHVYRHHYKIQLPLFNGIDANNNMLVSRLIDVEKTEWQELKIPIEGCAVAMSQNKVFHHVGVFVCGTVLHALGNQSVVAQGIDSLKRNGWQTIRFFKHREMA